ncbi:MAG: YebC/PmpR family DNA-binding transcriptional regulator [Planctomycetota bacterium]
MAGHSHWANIQRTKSKVDAKRGKVFSKWAKLIMAAARTGGSDISMNLPLRYAIDRAKADNMPKDSIERAVKKGAGELEGQQLEEVVYEAYAPGGVAFVIEALTDNRNRTAPNIRTALTKRGGSMANSGSVAYMFKRKAMFVLESSVGDEETVMDVALESGAEDVTTDEPGIYGIQGEPEEFMNLTTAFAEKEWVPLDAGLRYVPDNYIPVDADAAEKIQALVDILEEDDDVQAVHHNAEFPE